VIGGKAEIMKLFDAQDPARRVLISGTYNGHPLNVAAALATIERLRKDTGAVYRALEALGTRMETGLRKAFARKGVAATISRIGSAFCAYFSDRVPADWHDLAAIHDFEFDRRYRRALIDRGVYQFPLACKQGSISAAHTEADIDRTLEITEEALASL
jgi:glutamate-1-semialdehyde 2,1-aminomutase